jgi:uncharacterized membrane protein YfcA
MIEFELVAAGVAAAAGAIAAVAGFGIGSLLTPPGVHKPPRLPLTVDRRGG